MIIIGIIAVFALGRLDFTSTFEQKGVYDKLKAGLDHARKTAVAKRRCVQAVFGSGSVTFLYDSKTPEAAMSSTGVSCANSNFAAGNYVTLPAPDKDCVGAGNAVCSHRSGVISGGTSFIYDAQGAALATATFTVAGMPAITCGDGVSTGSICVEANTGYVH